MLFSFSKEEEEFRSEVKAFIEKSLTETLRAGAMASPAVFVEPDIGKIWQKLLADKGWLNYYWPEAYGGQGWSATKKYIFCLLYTSPSPRDATLSRMPSSA